MESMSLMLEKIKIAKIKEGRQIEESQRDRELKEKELELEEKNIESDKEIAKMQNQENNDGE